ncbi:MAG: metallophosphoesterase [Lachnospiraceae bacterium]|nr:metallophosphoesterase [Lachnospiraceae bacterium]
MKQLCLKNYDIYSRKIKTKEVRLHFLSDLHGLSFGNDHSFLLKVMKKRKPDLVLIGGDMLVGDCQPSWTRLEKLLEKLSQEFPVYYAMGNHEQKVFGSWVEEISPEAEELFAAIRENTIFLDNSSRVFCCGENRLRISGLSLEKEYYKKPFPQKLTREHICALLGEADSSDDYGILLSHNPYHSDACFLWGADLTLSGHYHGGVVRFGENRGLISTHFHPFPKYCCGQFQNGSSQLIVSPGMGEHSVKLRVHNPRELIEVRLLPMQ